jgi:hypothetical protein
LLVDIFEKLKNLVGGHMAMSQNSPEIYWKLWVKISWNILEKIPFRCTEVAFGTFRVKNRVP